MYAYIQGILAEKNTDTVVIECQGIGYEVGIPASDLAALPPVGTEIKIYTILSVSENSGVSLYGFVSRDEKELYRQLVGVSGVGPKAALSILSILAPNDLRFAIISDDEKAITKAAGVGPKMARRIILELKDKIDIAEIEDYGNQASELAGAVSNEAGSTSETLAALTALGYSSSEAMKAIAAVENGLSMDTEQLLKEALKKLSFL